MAGLLHHIRLNNDELYTQYLGRGEIRLVSVAPGSWPDEIVCHLNIVNMNRASLPSYRALSYVWGMRSRHPPSITVNGCRHQVTTNLECAIRCIRDESRAVNYWIDAICINQRDDAERSLQVSMMCEIYSRADDVLIFLGDDLSPRKRNLPAAQARRKITFSDSAVDDRLVEQVTARWCAADKRRSVQALDVFCLVHLLARSSDGQGGLQILSQVPHDHLTRIFEGLRSLLTLRWWLRIWVVQEAIVAKRLTVMYGNISAPWSMLVDAARSSINSTRDVLARGSVVPADDVKVLGLFSRVLDLNQSRATWRGTEKENLLSLLRHFSNRDASDNRDKIYALLGLCSSGVWPNYELSDQEAYTATTVQIMSVERSLSALGGDLGRKYQPDLPSWVPDWSWALDEYDHGRARYFDHYNACGNAREVVALRDRAHDDALEPCDGNTMTQLIGAEMRRLVEEIDPDGEAPENFFDLSLRPALLDYKKRNPSLEVVCDELLDLCREGGRRGFWGRSTITHLRLLDNDEDKLVDILKVSGRLVAPVAVVLEPLYSASHLTLAKETIKVWWKNTARARDPTRENLLLFATTLLSGFKMTATAGLIALSSADDDHLIFWLAMEVLDEPRWCESIDVDPPVASVIHSFTKAMELSTARRTMFITVAHTYGLGPASMATGDSVYVLPGGRLPFVLRLNKGEPVGGLINAFELVGDCYVNGVMMGEMALSPGRGSVLDEVFESGYWAIAAEFQSLGMGTRWWKGTRPRPKRSPIHDGITRDEVASFEETIKTWWNEERDIWSDERNPKVITDADVEKWLEILGSLRHCSAFRSYIYLI